MSPNSLRVLAGAAAAVLVLLTGIAVGLVGRAEECTPAPAPQQQTTAPSATPAPASPTGGGVVDNNPGGGSLGGTVGSRPERSNPPAEQPAPTDAATTQPPATQVAAPGPTCATESFAATPALVALAGAAAAAAVAIGLLLAAGLRRPPMPVSGPPAAAGPSRVPPGADPRLDADRAALVRACIYVRDRVTSRALGDRLAAALRDAGVTVVEPVGDRFDPARHEAGGATPAADPSLTGTIAAVEVPGYIDRSGRVLRAPVVTVYQAGSGGAGSTTGQHTTIPHTTTQRSTTQHPRRRNEEDR
jgi:hypothetical protein